MSRGKLRGTRRHPRPGSAGHTVGIHPRCEFCELELEPRGASCSFPVASAPAAGPWESAWRLCRIVERPQLGRPRRGDHGSLAAQAPARFLLAPRAALPPEQRLPQRCVLLTQDLDGGALPEESQA